MESQYILPLLMRFLPTIIVLALAFVAASDKKTGRQWANMMYQMGSVRPDQRDDPKVQSGVKWPFIVIAFALLFLPAHLGPISYYQWVTHKPEAKIDFSQGKALMDSDETLVNQAKEEVPTPTPAPQNPAPPGANPPPPSAPGAPSSAPRNNTTTPGSIGALR